MNPEVAALEPSAVWTQFERLNAVPRASKKEEQVIAFVVDFAKSHGLWHEVDDAGNVLIRKPATDGRENEPTIAIQAHLDMVHQKNAATDFDFATMGIRSQIADGWVTADGTTLGSDNGMGAASILAVLAADDLSHGPIEGLFTIDEETGMTGAFELRKNWLQADFLINTDTEDHGEFCIGCAGGVDTTASWDLTQTNAPQGVGIQIAVRGLRGGHSGCEIDLGRGNANKILARLLLELSSVHDVATGLVNMDGGGLRNAIPREATATLVVPESLVKAIGQQVATSAAAIVEELGIADPGMNVTVQSVDAADQVIAEAQARQVLGFLTTAPCGVIRYCADIPELVETSTSLARWNIVDNKIRVDFLSRSSVQSSKEHLCDVLSSLGQLCGAKVEHSGSYPGWKPDSTSRILDLAKKTFEDLFGDTPKVAAIHAGLECGIIGSHYPKMEMVSLGPTIKNPHSPDEKCEIESVGKYWKLLTEILRRGMGNA